MVVKCAGLPLAVKALGGTLGTKNPSVNDWSLVYDGIKSYLRGRNDGKKVLQVAEALKMSYLDLPYQLKQCFVHLGQFPEDYKIPTTRVINMWVAEGIIQKGSSADQIKEEEVEDVANRNLEDLVLRCMIQVEKRGSTGRITCFSMHDLMRDLSIQEAEKEKFFKSVYLEDGNYQEEDDSSPPPLIQSNSTRKIRRLSLYFMESISGVIPLEYERYAHIRGLLGFCLDGRVRIECESLVGYRGRNFKFLRVL
ncbi:Disease resistance protein [Quillaja saponaria]|uniref:Disease resistance protein n=1 Tax=Quillaja saponaria TaxID=32244 RepID=A0AAD7VFK3_QUISA|nr:Disease resistance protein [Quillaja saponaria]